MRKRRGKLRPRKQVQPRKQIAQSFDGPQITAPHASEFMNRLDPLNFVAVRLEPFYNDLKLGDGTGFFYYVIFNNKPTFYLVTNWRVLTGRITDNPLQPLLKNGCLPNKLRLYVLLRLTQPEYRVEGAAPLLLQELTIELYDSAGLALWYQHPRKNAFDVGVINGTPFGESYHLVGVNQVAKTNDMVIQLGNEIFIFGLSSRLYPFYENTDLEKRLDCIGAPLGNNRNTKQSCH